MLLIYIEKIQEPIFLCESNILLVKSLKERWMMEMAKRYRGKSLKKLPHKGRGECPLCKRTRIKLLYPYRTDSNPVFNVCKNCRNK